VTVAWKSGLWRWVSVVAIASLAVTAIAMIVALTAADRAGHAGRELSQRLLPAAAASAVLLEQYLGQQTLLRNYVTSGQPTALQQYRQVGAQIPGQQEKVATLVRGDQGMPGQVTAAAVAWRAWLARVAAPQLAAAADGNFAGARALQANILFIRPFTLAVRTPVMALQAQITSRQTRVTAHLAGAQGRVLNALLAVCVVVALIAVGGVVAVRRWLLAPFAALRAAAESIAAGSYDTPVPTVGPAELADLGRSTERMRTRLLEEVQQLNGELEARVRDRTADLEATTRELDAFAYSVSHDLRAPLRALSGFSQALLEDFSDVLDDTGKDYLHRMSRNVGSMGQMIDSLLNLSRATRADLNRGTIDLSTLTGEVAAELSAADPGRDVAVDIADDLRCIGDAVLLRMVLRNLLGNARKFSAKTPCARIEVGQTVIDGEGVFFVRDNGAGFDMRYVGKLFNAFQRLHSATDFEGTGVGLATVQRIISRHGGRIFAEAEPGKGATFYFTLQAATGGIR